jgi:hypothetical protein
MSASDEFRALLGGSAIKPVEVASFLDDLSHEARVEAVRATKRTDQRRLYEAVEGFAPVKLVDLVAPGVGAFETVRHFGKNTLPAFSHFEKRFCRGADADPSDPVELYGFNFQTMAPVTGPGYFVAVEDEQRDEVLVDYRRVPERHPEGWPEIRSNEQGLSRFVYGFMVDTLRRVSEHVTIGSAARKGKDMGSWFMLTREPGPS